MGVLVHSVKEKRGNLALLLSGHGQQLLLTITTSFGNNSRAIYISVLGARHKLWYRHLLLSTYIGIFCYMTF
jgi:hypothetical protein